MATIREYFDTDFSYTAKIHCRIQASELSVEAKVLIDVAGYKGFVSCFVPGAHHAVADYIELLKNISYGQPFGIVGTVTLPTIREFPGELRVKNLPNTIELMARFYGHPGQKSFYTGQCPEWGHPLEEALIVRWIGLHFFFSFELSYLKVPRKPRLDVARWPARKPLAVRSFIVQNGGAWS